VAIGKSLRVSTFSGKVTSAGLPLPGVLVVVAPAQGRGRVRTTTTLANGTFGFPKLADGRYYYRTCLEGFASTYGVLEIESGYPRDEVLIQTAYE
jgi:hypothetical protein